MIKVNRSRVPVPSVLSGPTSVGEAERASNAALLRADPGAKLRFRAYKHSSVAPALEQLFLGKCAYCESQYINVQPVDVEHFRPKSEVHHTRGTAPMKGYWWLAAEWENLYASCIDCNRARYHPIQAGGRGQFKRGKENLFPLQAPICPAHTEGCEKLELPLLLDPCVDDPDQYLDWSDEGAVIARTDSTGSPLAKAKHSVECYGLDRGGLLAVRLDRATLVRATIINLKRAEENARIYQSDLAFLGDVRREVATLQSFLEPNAPFCGMARRLVVRHYGPLPQRFNATASASPGSGTGP